MTRYHGWVLQLEVTRIEGRAPPAAPPKSEAFASRAEPGPDGGGHPVSIDTEQIDVEGPTGEVQRIHALTSAESNQLSLLGKGTSARGDDERETIYPRVVDELKRSLLEQWRKIRQVRRCRITHAASWHAAPRFRKSSSGSRLPQRPH